MAVPMILYPLLPAWGHSALQALGFLSGHAVMHARSAAASQEAGNLSILFDVGGVAGGAIAGALSDAASAPACVSAAFVFGSVPFM